LIHQTLSSEFLSTENITSQSVHQHCINNTVEAEKTKHIWWNTCLKYNTGY